MANTGKISGIKAIWRRKIETGEWPAGYRMPSQRVLAVQYGVNRSTIAEVSDALQAEGLLQTDGRRGSFVASHGWNGIASRPMHWGTAAESGFYQKNQPMVQAINQLEFEPSYVRLGTGELSPELYPKQLMTALMAQAAEAMPHMGYECPLGYPPLRAALSRHLSTLGIEASPESILITSGSLQALHLISIGLMHPTAKVYTEGPSYIYSLNTLRSVGLNLETVEMDWEGLNLEALKLALESSGPKEHYLYTIPTFQNPTCKVMSQSRREHLLTLANRWRLPIIEDDAYRHLWLDEAPPKPLKASDREGNVLYLGTFSKIIAAGLRIGWIVGPEPAVKRLGDLKMQLDYGASGPSQAIATEWLNSDAFDQVAASVREALRHRRRICMDLVAANFEDLATWETPKGGFYIWLKLNEAVSATHLFEEALKLKILLNHGDIYAQSETNAIRLSYAYASETQMVEKIPELAALIRALSSK